MYYIQWYSFHELSRSKQEAFLAKAVIALIVGMALVALCQYSVVQAPYGFNYDPLGYACMATLSVLDHFSVGLHLDGLRGAQVAANAVTLIVIAGIFAFIYVKARNWRRNRASRREMVHFVQHGSNLRWGGEIATFVIVPLIAVGAFWIFGLKYFVPSTTFWVPSMPAVAVSTMIVLVLLLIAIGRPRPQA